MNLTEIDMTDRAETLDPGLFLAAPLAELLAQFHSVYDEDREELEHTGGLNTVMNNVWSWTGWDGACVPRHTDTRVGDVHMTCLEGSRRFVGGFECDTIDRVLQPGDRVTFDSRIPHEVYPGPGKCILLCCGDA